jgi:hypothetical protein
LFALDLTRPPATQASARFELVLLHFYRARLSPWIGAAGVRCRFEPTCSRYAEAAIAESGGLIGPLRAAWRIVRCGPWTPPGSVDRP